LAITELLTFASDYMFHNNEVVAIVFGEQKMLNVCYHRLGHVHFAKMKHISCIPVDAFKCASEVCVTGPLA